MILIRTICLVFFSLLLVAASSLKCLSQVDRATTIILLRHAEKDTTSDNPSLSAAGRRRAERLPVVFKKWKPDAFYSTGTLRTMQTLQPWARMCRKEIQRYDASEQAALCRELKALSGKTVVVVGHSNTIPQLANMILGSGAYSNIPDREFGMAWIITIRNGKVSAVVKKY